ncbi:MAG TPA: hypothetical protein VEK07_19905 [Polyangiaceae bacterium]|nr:hypothetical protein [Polyangiaceae bacterium]
MQARKIIPFAVAAVILGAAGFAMSRSDRPAMAPESVQQERSAQTGSAPAAPREPNPSTVQGATPPAGPAASRAVMGSENGEPPGVSWSIPDAWEPVRNPNGMRLATYRVRNTATGEESVDISVARAGGSPDANIERWLGQFDANPTVRRNDKTLNGLSVTLVDIGGTYRGGGMMPGAPTNPRPDWVLLAAIVSPSTGAPYFFKVLGPKDAVQKARPAFGALIASLAPSP